MASNNEPPVTRISDSEREIMDDLPRLSRFGAFVFDDDAHDSNPEPAQEGASEEVHQPKPSVPAHSQCQTPQADEAAVPHSSAGDRPAFGGLFGGSLRQILADMGLNEEAEALNSSRINGSAAFVTNAMTGGYLSEIMDEMNGNDENEKVEEADAPSSVSSVAPPTPAGSTQEGEEMGEDDRCEAEVEEADAPSSPPSVTWPAPVGHTHPDPQSVDYNKDQEDSDIYEYPSEDWFKHAQAAINFGMQMMFVSGETAEPSVETTTLIEEITRQQVLEMLTRSTDLAARRGSRAISINDLIFLIRHDKQKVERLRSFLSWKDVRKNVKDSDDKGGADAADFAAADDAAGVAAGSTDIASKPKNKRAKVALPWDHNSFFSVQVPECEDDEDDEEEGQNAATLQRLAAADERTKHMTKEEYVFWSECRQASFTYRKAKRFREWAGFGVVTESKPNDDIVDILGFLTFEIVQTLTEEALKVKEREDHWKNRGGADAGDAAKKRKRETGLFDPPEEGRTPIEPRHIHEAFRKLQAVPRKRTAMHLHNGRLPPRFPLQFI